MDDKFAGKEDNRTGITDLNAVNLAQILEASPNEIYIFDGETLQIEYANPQAIENLGYSLEQLQQMTALDLKSQLTEEAIKELVAPLINGEKTQINLETIHRRANGSTYPVEVYLQLIQEKSKSRFFAIVIDISERKQTEEYLQNTVAQLETIADNLPGIIYQIQYSNDGTWQCQYVSDNIENFLDISKEKLYEDMSNFVNLIHEEDYANFIELRNRTLKQIAPFFWEGRVITPSNRLVWIQIRSEPKQQADGSIIRNGICLDITSQKQAELALRESEEIFRQFAENIDDVFWMLNGDITELIYISPSFERVWGYSRHELWQDFHNFFLNTIYPEDRATVENATPKKIVGEYDIEYRIIRSDGEIRWVRDRAFPVTNEKGEPYRIAGIAQDITEEKEAQVKIAWNQQLREVIFNEATDALYLIEPETLTIIDCNRRAVELSDAQNKQSLINLEANFLHDKPVVELKKNIEKKGFLNEEILLKTFQNDQFYGDIVWKKITVAEKSIYLVRVTDISERKAFETELQTANESLELTNQELTRATRLKDEFLASMSHELKTPLNTILGMSEGLKEGSFEAINEQQQQAVKTISTSATHLLDLINDILDFAKLQSGKVTLNFTQANIQSLCENSLTFVRQTATQKRIELKTHINTSCSALNVDELRLRQILINLLSNAVKFTPEGGQVTLAVTEDSLREHIIFTVSDTGIGIASEQLHRLFEPFVQLDSQLNRQYSGTGLGLSLVRRLSELHGGNVFVESEVNKGSTFYVKIPYTEVCFISNQDTLSFSSNNITHFNISPLILLINADQASLDTTSSYLEAYGYEIWTVMQEQDLLPSFEKFTPQVIVIDLQTLKSVGEKMIQQMRDIPSLNEVPIIALTADSEEEDILALGANRCLMKPVRMRHLLNEIQRWLPEEFQQ